MEDSGKKEDAPAIKGRQVVALESRLKGCKNVITLGVKPNFSDYSEEEARLILESPRVYYPSAFYADILDAIGVNIFPSRHTYHFAQDKIMQTAIFQALKIPHPRTHIYYGATQQKRILDDFKFPFIAKVPRGSSQGKGVFLIQSELGLKAYLGLVHAAYIQELIPGERDIRVVVVGEKPILAYWRVAAKGSFMTNIAQGGKRDFAAIPYNSMALATETATKCGFDDVGIDIRIGPDGPMVLEANMKYGRDAFKEAGLEYKDFIEACLEKGII